MKITNIIIEAIKAMGDNMGEEISSALTYDKLKGDNDYKDRVVGSMGIINRGLLRAYQLGGIAAKSIELTDKNYSNGRIDTTKVVNIGKVVGIFDKNNLAVSYSLMGEYVIASGAVTLVYQPRPQIEYADMDKAIEDCGIPLDVANALALYCKYEMYQEDKVELAKEALAAFDSIIAKAPMDKVNDYSCDVLNRAILRAYQLGGIAAKSIELTEKNYSGGRIDTTKVDYFGKVMGVYASNRLIASHAMGEYIIAEHATSMAYVPLPQIADGEGIASIKQYLSPELESALPLYLKYEQYQHSDMSIAKEAITSFDSIVSKQSVDKGNEYTADALNRGLIRAYQLNGIAARTHEIASSDKIDTREIPSYGKLVGVYNAQGRAISYRQMGEYIMADNASNIVYMPLPQIADGEGIASIKQYLSPELESALPLYLKYEQYQHSDMSIAKESISSFDNIVAKLAPTIPVAQEQSHVELVYSMDE